MKVIRVNGNYANGRFEAKGFRVLNKGDTLNNDFNTITNCIRCRARNVEPYLEVEPINVVMFDDIRSSLEYVYSNISWNINQDK